MTSRIAPQQARSWLLVPASKPDTFDAALASAADAVILDLEDAVTAPNKPAARRDVAAFLSEHNHAWVRINDATTPFWEEDLAVLAGLPGLEGVMLAKTESGQQADATAERLPDGTKILALVESAVGLEAAPEIARTDGIFRLAFGSGDFRRDTGDGRLPHVDVVPRVRGSPSPAARHASLRRSTVPRSAPDLDLLARDCAITLSLGMAGKLCMTTAQTAPVNAGLSPSVADAIWAQNVIDDLGEDGSRVRDGSDLPKLAKAKKIHKLATLFHIPTGSLIFLLLNRCRKRQALKSERLTFVF